MIKNTGSRTVTTFNFVGSNSASYVWNPAETADADWLVQGWGDAHRQNASDAAYLAEFGRADTFEYEVPGLKILVLLVDGEIMTVFEIADETASRITRAARREQPVTISYTKADGEETVRTIEPTSLALTKAGDTIVKAIDRKSGEARSFRLDRISTYTVHRTRRTVRREAPAPTKAELWQQWTARKAERTVTLHAFSEISWNQPSLASRWTESVRWGDSSVLEGNLAALRSRHANWTEHTAPGLHLYVARDGHGRVLFVIEEARKTPETVTILTDVYSTEPEAAAVWDDEGLLDRLADAHARGREYLYVTV